MHDDCQLFLDTHSEIDHLEREWAQRISDGALRSMGHNPEPIPWVDNDLGKTGQAINAETGLSDEPI